MKPDISDEKLKKIYSLAHKIARTVVNKYHISYLDEEDFVQEAVMGWLTGRNMYLAAMDALRRYGPLTKDGVANKENPPDFLEYNDHSSIPYLSDLDQDDAICLTQVLEAIPEIPNSDCQYAVLASYFGEKTLQEISNDLGFSSKRSAFELRRKGLDYLKRELGVTDDSE